MLHIVIVLAWLIALGLAVYLANRAIKHRLWGRQERRRVLKRSREFRRHHHFDDKRQYWVRNVDQVPLIDDSIKDRRFSLTFIGWLLFILWRATGFGKLEHNSSKAVVSNCHMCFYFSSWSSSRSPGIYSASEIAATGDDPA
jgi:hypothetical protein